jgi:hypothetical protein
VSQHIVAGTFRRDRHAVIVAPPVRATEDVAAADRRRCLVGLSPAARRLAVRLLAELTGWDAQSLALFRSYLLSFDRLQVLEAAGVSPDLYRELRAHLELHRRLGLEK